MARIYKKNNSYYFSFEAGRDERTGKRQRIVRGGFRTKKEAQQASAELEVKFNIGKVIAKPSDITLHDFMWKHWLEYHKRFVKPSTVKAVSSVLKRIDRYFNADIKLKDITPHNCNQFAVALLDDFKLERNVASRSFSYFKTIFKYAVQTEKIIIQNPCDNIEVPKYTLEQKNELQNKKQNKLLYLEKNDLQRLLQAAAKSRCAFPYYTILLIMAYTGMRIGEVLALQWQDIDLKKKSIHCRHTLFRPNADFSLQSAKTSNSIRDISITDNLIAAIKEYRKQFLMFKLEHADKWIDTGYDFVFTARTKDFGKPVYDTTIQYWLDRLAKQNNMPHLYPHLFRHTHVSLLAEAGVSLPAIRERLGHSSDKITEKIYLHVTRKHKSDAAMKFEKLLSNS